MHPRILLNLCKRSLYRASYGITLNIKRSSHAVGKDEEKQQKEIFSMTFPDYKVVYIFPFINQVCAINGVKRRFTVFVGAATPVIVGLYLTSILSFQATVTSIALGKIPVNLL